MAKKPKSEMEKEMERRVMVGEDILIEVEGAGSPVRFESDAHCGKAQPGIGIIYHYKNIGFCVGAMTFQEAARLRDWLIEQLDPIAL